MIRKHAKINDGMRGVIVPEGGVLSDHIILSNSHRLSGLVEGRRPGESGFGISARQGRQVERPILARILRLRSPDGAFDLFHPSIQVPPVGSADYSVVQNADGMGRSGGIGEKISSPVGVVTQLC